MEVLGDVGSVGSAEWGLGGNGDDGGDPPASQIVTMEELEREIPDPTFVKLLLISNY